MAFLRSVLAFLRGVPFVAFLRCVLAFLAFFGVPAFRSEVVCTHTHTHVYMHIQMISLPHQSKQVLFVLNKDDSNNMFLID